MLRNALWQIRVEVRQRQFPIGIVRAYEIDDLLHLRWRLIHREVRFFKPAPLLQVGAELRQEFPPHGRMGRRPGRCRKNARSLKFLAPIGNFIPVPTENSICVDTLIDAPGR